MKNTTLYALLFSIISSVCAIAAPTSTQWRSEEVIEDSEHPIAYPASIQPLPANWYKLLTLYKDENWRNSPFIRTGAIFVEISPLHANQPDKSNEFVKLHVLWDSRFTPPVDAGAPPLPAEGFYPIYQEKHEINLKELQNGYTIEAVEKVGTHKVLTIKGEQLTRKKDGTGILQLPIQLIILTEGGLFSDSTNDEVKFTLNIGAGVYTTFKGAFINVVRFRKAPRGIRRVHLCNSDKPTDTTKACPENRMVLNWGLTSEERKQPLD